MEGGTQKITLTVYAFDNVDNYGRHFTDIDECSDAGLHTCHVHANCTDTQGNYTCSCKEGFAGDGRYNCTGAYDRQLVIDGIYCSWLQKSY